VVTRESTLRESFDPVAFHRTASMAQTGWADREERRAAEHRFQDNVARFSGTITFIVGVLIAMALRPPDLMDGRDVAVSAAALAVSLAVGVIGAKIIGSVFRTTSVEVDRVVMWVVTLVAAVGLAAAGTVPSYARDADDFLTDIPGYTVTTPASLEPYHLARDARGVFSGAGLWALETNGKTVGALGVYLMGDGRARGELKMMADALQGRSVAPRRAMVAGQSVLVGNSGSHVQLGWIDGSALVVVSGAHRSAIEPAAAALLRARD
jgi:hypothetical protein